MSHSHNHSHAHGDAERNISVAFFLNAFFVVVELVGGLWTNSIAILSDAFHDFGDCLSLATAWFLQRKSAQGRNSRYSYGYGRWSLLGTIFLSGVLSVSSCYVIIEGVGRIINPQPVDADGMLWIAIFGVLINGAAALRMSHGSSLNERAVFLHIMEDVLGWVAVLLVSIVMLFVHIPMLDSLLSIGISLWVLWNVFGNMRKVFRILLQGTPEDISLPELESSLEAVPGVEAIHDLHLWSIDGEKHVMTLHVVTSQDNTGEIKAQILDVAKKYHIVHSTIEFEKPSDTCTTNCDASL